MAVALQRPGFRELRTAYPQRKAEILWLIEAYLSGPFPGVTASHLARLAESNGIEPYEVRDALNTLLLRGAVFRMGPGMRRYYRGRRAFKETIGVSYDLIKNTVVYGSPRMPHRAL